MRINIYLNDNEVINHLNKQLNKSRYISELIKSDINNSSLLTKDEIIKLIKQYSSSTSDDNDIKDAFSTMFT